MKESHFFLSPGRTHPLSNNYKHVSEVFSISKQRSICFTNMYFSTSFSINKSYRFFCQHLSLTFPRNRSYIYMFMYIFSPSNYFAAILHCRICPISTIFPNFFFIAESLYFPIKLLIRLQHLSLSILSWSM